MVLIGRKVPENRAAGGGSVVVLRHNITGMFINKFLTNQI